jgi:glycerol uptake facilitator-like aquaporin
VTTLQKKSVRFGQVNLSLLTGESLTRLSFVARQRKSIVPSRYYQQDGNKAGDRQDRAPMKFNLCARLTAEFLGSAFLVAAVIGSGIMGERLAGGNIAIALLANSVATGAALVALILTFGPISGAHLNPAVTLADAIEDGISWPDAVAYMLVQCAGAVAGAIVAHLMFGLHWYSLSSHSRHGWTLVLSEFVATFGLLSVIWGSSRLRSGMTPFAVASYIMAAYWFTASTSFANPAVTIARCLSDTFAGIRPADAPLFVAAQFAGSLAATVMFRWLVPNLLTNADQVVVPHSAV